MAGVTAACGADVAPSEADLPEDSKVVSGAQLPFGVLGDLVAGRFTGDVYFKALINHDAVYNFSQTNNITFAPKARSFWHHHGPMVLIGAGGTGHYQEEGKQAVEIHPGDVVFCRPALRHWHGASSSSWFSQIVIYDPDYKPEKPWPESAPVSDADYEKAQKTP